MDSPYSYDMDAEENISQQEQAPFLPRGLVEQDFEDLINLGSFSVNNPPVQRLQLASSMDFEDPILQYDFERMPTLADIPELDLNDEDLIAGLEEDNQGPLTIKMFRKNWPQVPQQAPPALIRAVIQPVVPVRPVKKFKFTITKPKTDEVRFDKLKSKITRVLRDRDPQGAPENINRIPLPNDSWFDMKDKIMKSIGAVERPDSLQYMRDLFRVLETKSVDKDFWYKLFRFFCTINKQVVHDPASAKVPWGQDQSFPKWKEASQLYLGDPFNNFRIDPDIRAEYDGKKDYLIHRINSSMLGVAIELVMTQIQHRYRDTLVAMIVNSQFLFQADPEDPNFDNLPDQELIDFVWNLLLSIFIIMRKLWSMDIKIVDLMRSGKRYHEHTKVLPSGDSYIEAFPHLITTFAGNKVQNNPDPVADHLRQYLMKFREYPIDYIDIKVRVKKLCKRDDAIRPDMVDEVYFVVHMNPLSMMKEYDEQEHSKPYIAVKERNEFGKTLHPSNQKYYLASFKYFLTPALDNMSSWAEEKFRGWFLDELWYRIDQDFDQYKDTWITNEDMSRDTRCLMIDGFDIFAKYTDPNFDPKLNRLAPVHCSSIAKNIFQKCGLMTEVLDNGCCLWEAHWTVMNYNLCNRGGTYYAKEKRLKKILLDFHELDDLVKLVYIQGDLEAYKGLAETNNWPVQVVILEGLETLNDLDRQPNKVPILCFDGHACATSWDKLENYIKNLHAVTNESDSKGMKVFGKNPCIVLPDALSNYYFDIETYDENGHMRPYLIVVTSKVLPEPKVFWGVDDCVELFIEWFKTLGSQTSPRLSLSHRKREDKIYFWSYNGCKFDLIFLLRHFAQLPLFEMVGSLTSPRAMNVGNIVFLDLMKIIPYGSLNDQCKFWKTEKQKTSMDHTIMNRKFTMNLHETDPQLKADIIKYCINDCEALGEVCTKYRTFFTNTYHISPYQVSEAGVAFTYYKTFMLEKGLTKLSKKGDKQPPLSEGVPKKHYPQLQNSYKGGMVFLTMRQTPKGATAYMYDRNSSYPAVMSKYKMPVAFKEFTPKFNDPVLQWNWESVIQDQALYVIHNMRFKKEHWLPLLPKRAACGLLYELEMNPVEYIWGVELKEALMSGMVEECLCAGIYYFELKHLFDKFIPDVYARRLEAKARGDEVGVKSLKTMMNSVYGKFAQKLYPSKKIVNEEQLLFYLNSNISEGNISDIVDLNFGLMEITFNHNDYEKQVGSNIQIASFITAGARAALAQAARIVSNNFTKQNIVYGDTDSLVTLDPLPAALCDENELGFWKMENTIKEDSWIGIAPKVYYFENKFPNKDGVMTKKMRFKGLHDKNLTHEHYLRLLVGNLTISSGDVWKRHLLGYIIKAPNVKNIKPVSRRLFVSNYESYPLSNSTTK